MGKMSIRMGLTGLCFLLLAMCARAQAYIDNDAPYPSQNPANETRRSEHFRVNFGHFNRDTGTAMTEQLAQGNLQMFEQMWRRWVTELGLHDINESVTQPDGRKYRTNFNVLMTWNDGGGGGAYSSMDAKGFFYAMANTGYCRFDPPSGAVPHEFGHVWEGSAGGFNSSDSSGSWWECTANWMMLQFVNSYPQAGGYITNGMYYPAHGRDYYDSWVIWEAAREDPRYGPAWVNDVWTSATADQQAHEFIIDRMVRVDRSGSPDKAGASRDLWGAMARRLVTWDFERQRWLAQANSPDDGSDWYFYQRARTPLEPVPGMAGWFRASREHLPQEYGFNIIPLTASAGATATCDFQPQCDPVRQSDWRACLVAVDDNGGAHYSTLWNCGRNAITLADDVHKLYLVVIATPRPMKIADPAWKACLTDAGLQFPYMVSFTNTAPKNVTYPPASHASMHQLPLGQGGGWVSNSATVDPTAYVGPDAQVLDSARVLGNARITDYAVVRNSAQVRDHAVVSGHAVVQDTAQVYGNAKVRDWARVFGNARVYDNARVIEHANCGDSGTTVFGNAVVKGTTYVYSPSTLSGSLIMDGDSANGGTGDHGVHFGWSWGADQGRLNGLPDNNSIYIQHTFEKDNAVFALDEYGINHGFLMNGCRAAVSTGASTRGGLVLPLDSAGQYVELHRTANDFHETSIGLWVKWTGATDGQRIWSMGNGAEKSMYLTPRDGATGKLRLVISDGQTTESLDGTAALTAGVWAHVMVVFGVGSCTLYVNGTAVASNPSITLHPDDLNAPLMENANYLGRGNAGHYFQGELDDFRVYMKALSGAEVAALAAAAAPAPLTPATDTTPPTPATAAWLVPPTPLNDHALVMSAAPGSDDSGWVEYYFACTAGGGPDSGWVSFNRFTALGLTPGVTYAYTVKMRDRSGNATNPSVAASAATPVALTPGPAAFANRPAGISGTAIRMSAQKLDSPSGLVEYRFTRDGSVSSGWQASPTWTDTGLVANSSHTYAVQVRDARGNTSAPSAAASATAADMTAPQLPIAVAHWAMAPYATIDNKVSMTAMDGQDPSGVQYYFHCAQGGGPDSGWQNSATFVTPALADGAYVYQYKLRDKSALANESDYSTTFSATITPATGYHAYGFGQLPALPDDTLVNTSATVMRVNPGNYLVKDPVSGTTMTVRTSAYAEATAPANVFKSVNIKGHLYRFGGSPQITFATVTPLGNAPGHIISGMVTGPGGAAIAGATVYLSDAPDASANPVTTTTTDASGAYRLTVPSGSWILAAGSPLHNTSADRGVVVSGADVGGVNFSLAATARLSGGVVQRTGGAPLAGATVYFSKSPNAAMAPVYTATTDGTGNYQRSLQDGTWYVSAAATGFYGSADQVVRISGVDVAGVGFALNASVRAIPQTQHLLFGCVTDSLPATGATGAWTTLYPVGRLLAPMASPTVEVIKGIKWEKNFAADGDGYRFGNYTAPIPCNGASIVVAVRPARNPSSSTSWISCVDVFYDRLLVGVRSDTGKVCVRRNGSLDLSSGAIPDGQPTVLSLVVLADGSYKVWANGAEMMAKTATGNMTSLVPGVAGTFATCINVGRNDPDGWSTFNGNLGDVFLYDMALSDAERQQLEGDIKAKIDNSGTTLTMTAKTSVGRCWKRYQ